jgi:hydroxyethylthiazole kinase-like uncharacterized protein yjeF
MFSVSSGPEVLAADDLVINQCGIPSIVLMEKAADAVVFAMRDFFPDFSKCKFAIICGNGNNGADGVAIARNLLCRFAQVDVFLLSRENGFIFKSEEGKSNLRILLDDSFMQGLRVIEWNPETPSPNLGIYDGVVDAMFGAGFNSSKPIDIFYKFVISEMNLGKFIVSVDVPSGQCPTTGQGAGALKSSITVTFGMIKSGLVTYPGKSHCGKIYYSPISYPREILTSCSSKLIVPASLPPRDPDGYKCTFGRGLFVAGCRSYFGAPFLSSASFMRCGGGYAKLFSLDQEKVYPEVASHMPEIVFLQEDFGRIGENDVVVIGPGLGQSNEAVELVRLVITTIANESETNSSSLSGVVIDGDGLNLLVSAFGDSGKIVNIFASIMKLGIPIVLTPHLGELKRLLWPPDNRAPSFPHSVVLPDKPHFFDYVTSTKLVCEQLCELPNLIVVVKGSTTCVVNRKDAIRINVTGNSGMGTAGTGDVLCGVIANMLIRKIDVIDSVATAVWIHGRAGDLAKETIGENGMVASDLLDHLPHAVREVSETETYRWKKYYPKMI